MNELTIFISSLFLILVLVTVLLNTVCFIVKMTMKGKKVGRFEISDIISVVNMIVHAVIFFGLLLYTVFEPNGSLISEEELLIVMLLSSVLSMLISNTGREDK